MDAHKAVAVGLALVAVSQFCYLTGGLAQGLSLNGLVTLVSLVCAAVAALGLYTPSRGAPASFVGAMAIYAAIQDVEFLLSLGSFPPFLVGFAFVALGLTVVAVSAWNWRKSNARERPRGMRWGGGLACVGAVAYVGLGDFAPSLFTLGAVLAAIGWAVVSLG